MRALAAIAVALLPLAAVALDGPPEPAPRHGVAPAEKALAPAPAEKATPAAPAEPPAPPVGKRVVPEPRRLELDYELNPYYSTASVFLSISDEPIPHLGEVGELEMYFALLPRAFDPRSFIPKFLVLEASVNPLPCVGLLIRDRWPDFYRRATIFDGQVNWVRAVTAGFEEPYALSVLGGQFVNFDAPGRSDVTGKGYGGLLVSVGTHHIKDNLLYRDNWIELESKVKGDRKSPVKKLSWSFRIGAKFHSNPDIADILYLGLRRSRLDFSEHPPPFISNWGVEYRFDLAVDRLAIDGLRQARHVLFADKKLLLPGRKFAVTLKTGFIYTLKSAYRGALATPGEGRDFQFILQPNIEF
jgi:hypothetical protein